MPQKIKSREEKFTMYLVGEGIRPKLPKLDRDFYRLAGLCAGATWRINAGCGQMAVGTNAAQSNGSESDLKMIDKASRNDEKESIDEIVDCLGDKKLLLFSPKKSLPYPIYQETYSKWKGSMDMNLGIRRARHKKIIYIQPLNGFPQFFTDFHFIHNGSSIGFFQLLEEFTRCFFLGLDARALAPVPTDSWKAKQRVHKVTGEPQLLADDLNAHLARLLPRDGQAMVGVSWTDLYPSERLNFVLGETSAVLHTATLSFGRYETKLFERCGRPEEIEALDGPVIWKVLKVLAHETCHTFFLSHCAFFDCLMNESSSVAEAMAQPMHLCPVCTSKLQKVCRFRVRPWLAGLHQFLRAVHTQYPCARFESELAWLELCAGSMAAME